MNEPDDWDYYGSELPFDFPISSNFSQQLDELLLVTSSNSAHSLNQTKLTNHNSQGSFSWQYYQCIAVFASFIAIIIACVALCLRLTAARRRRSSAADDDSEAAKPPPSYEELLKNPQLFPRILRRLESVNVTPPTTNMDTDPPSSAAACESPPDYRNLIFWFRQLSQNSGAAHTAAPNSGAVQAAEPNGGVVQTVVSNSGAEQISAPKSPVVTTATITNTAQIRLPESAQHSQNHEEYLRDVNNNCIS